MNIRLLCFLSLLCVFVPHIGTAQYMFLDTNGDGLSTAADQIDPGGPTTLDVWIRTDTNRDGSTATCGTEDGDLTINSYEFILHAAGGTVSWSGFTNHQPDFNINLGHGESATDYHNGQGGGVILEPGTYRLASVTVSVVLGTPSIAIAASTPLAGVYLTSFGSRCSGNDFDNTLKLGSDWFDADGAPFGGALNQPPRLDPLADMALAENTVAEQELHASDPEGQALTFALESGPGYATVSTTDPGTGEASGFLRLTPGNQDGGDASATVSASDGILTDTASLTIHVTDVNTAPSLSPLEDVTIIEGSIRTFPLHASDPEQDVLQFSVLSGPSYVSVRSISPSSGVLHIAPSYADAGEADATIQVSDGALTDAESFHITVTDPFPVHNQVLARPSDMLVPSGSIAEQTLHAVSPDGNPVQFFLVSGPSFVTVMTVSSDPSNATATVRAAPSPSDVGTSEVTVSATDGIATDTKSFQVATGDAQALPDPAHPLFQGHYQTYGTGAVPQGLAAADLDGDGILDIVSANLSASLTILRGRADGTFDRRDDYPLGEEPYSVAIGDLNKDGRPDMAVADSGLSVVSVLLSIGTYQYGRRIDVGTPNKPAHVKLADWDEDGNLDMVVSNEGANMISLHRGKGDGTFFPHMHYPVGLDPCYADDGDFNGDGNLDVVVANEGSNNLSVLLGNGDGTLAPQTLYVVGHEPRSVEVGDLNGDGILDLAAANFVGNTVSVLLGNGNGTFGPHTEYACGESPWSTALGDLNGDGHLDIVTANVSDNTTSILLGSGSGAFPTETTQPEAFFTRYVVLGDADRDGSLDLIVANEGSSSVTVSLGRGDGGFFGPSPYTVGEQPTSAAFGDWNGDEKVDLAVGRGTPLTNGDLQIHFGTGTGGFQPGTVIPGLVPAGLVAGDWDEDGALDLAALVRDPNRISVFRGGGDGTLGSPVEYALPDVGPMIAARLPEGPLDLVCATFDPPTLVILDGSGDGSFNPRVPIPLPGTPAGLVAGDWNGDGLADLIVSIRSPSHLIVLLGAADGSWTPAPSIPLNDAAGVAAADLNGDGIADLALTLSPSRIFLPIRGDEGSLEIRFGFGNGTFGAPRELQIEPVPGWVRALDVNGDGRTDLAVHSGFTGTLSLLHGLGNGEFAPKSDFGTGGIMVDAAELNGDGRVDFVSSEFLMARLGIWINRGTFPVGTNRPPFASAGGPYSGTVAAAVMFDGTGSSDPDGEPLTMTWNFGDGNTGVGAQVEHTYSSDGSFPVSLTVSDGKASDSESTTATIAAELEARAITAQGQGTIRLFAGKPSLCIQLEPVEGAFALDQVDLATVKLHSEGTGTVDEIGAVMDKSATLLDRDRNGVDELQVCFGIEDARLLFASVAGTQDVSVSVEGALLDGSVFRAHTTLRVMGAPGFPSAFVAPNPVNPAATLFVATSKAGRLKATLYDAAGRKVRVIADHASTQPGVHELRFEGRTDQGTYLPSGIYFYLVESTEGTTRGRVSILK